MTDKDLTDISIVIPAYNAASFLQDAIDSILAQTRPAREIIIVNDGSRDDTLVIARRNEGQQACGTRILVIDQKNAGVSAARNKGAGHAGGQYIAFMDADDAYLPGFLAEAERAFRIFPDSAGFFCNQTIFNNEGDSPVSWFDGKSFMNLPMTARDGICKPDQSLFSVLLLGSFVPPSASVLSRDVAMSVGLFDPGITTSEDRDFFCRIALFGDLVYSMERLSRVRIHDSNVSFTTDSLKLSYNSVRVLQKFHGSRWASYMTDSQRQAVRDALRGAQRDYRYFASLAGFGAYLGALTDPAGGLSLADLLSRDGLRAIFSRGGSRR